MAIYTVNYDENNNPNRTKYIIVVLTNLDHNNWTKSDTYDPVLNQIETRLLNALEIRDKRVLKSGDVKQAFVQATLTDNENTFFAIHQGVLSLHINHIGFSNVHYTD